MINRLDSESAGFAAALARLRRLPAQDGVQESVAAILRRVRAEGDAALLELTAQFDGFSAASAAALFLPPESRRAARAQIPPPLCRALEEAAARIGEYHRRQMPESWRLRDANGNISGEDISPVARAAVYAPGGLAAYPSSVLMGVIPAKIAGVADIMLMTPPTKSGILPPAVLAAAEIAGVDSVLMLGGAQAVAAAAFGTETIRRADVVAGPGNAFVAEAKRQVFGYAGIDSPAGPSEVVIISDDSTAPEWVAADMLAQAEHDANAQSIAISPSRAHLDKVAESLAAQTARQPRAKIIAESLAARGALITAPTIARCCEIANDIAPEHAQVMCENAEETARRICNAGGLFVGAYSSVALGDYGAGPNHILPTAGAARFASPLGVSHFLKRTGFLQTGKTGTPLLAAAAALIAEAEGLHAHAAAAKLRAE
ncbi:MAG: histidinol dehydrogenase [Gammaproteobacteria bacterium]